MENSVRFLNSVVKAIRKQDSLHGKTLAKSLFKGDEFNELREVVCGYFIKNKILPQTVALDYLHMVQDMRREGIYFEMNNEYRCKSEWEAYLNVYSKPEVMAYYINALLISQLLWSHHFKMFQFYKKNIDFLQITSRILDIGSGHGLYSYYAKQISDYGRVDILDISTISLDIAQSIVGTHNAFYLNFDLNKLNENLRYEFIILGEILEHLDNPLDMLTKATSFLTYNGVIWLTVPTNAPAIDHVYLFRSKGEVIKLIDDAGLQIISHFDCQVDYVTRIIGAFCMKK